MFLDPNKLAELAPAEVLEAAASGHLALDHRFLHSLLDRREESLPALLHFAQRDRSRDVVDLAPELTALFRCLKTPDAVPFFISYIRDAPEEIPDEVMEALVEIGRPALEPLIVLYRDLKQPESGEVAFILASLRIQDERVREILLERSDYDPSDTDFLLELYTDTAAKPSEKPFDIWALYPEEADLPVEQLDEDERVELLEHPVEWVRAAAAASFFNRELSADLRAKLLLLTQNDPSPTVRARAWEALTAAIDEPEVLEAMVRALRNSELSTEERGGLLVGLAPEADRTEVRRAIVNLYDSPGGRAKALEAMWRSLHPSFREYFAKHLDDPELEIRRGAVWGIGYYGLKGELDRLRKLFDDEDLRSDAVFAYTLVLPAEVSSGRMKALLTRIEKDARGLSEMEEELVKTALDERLMLAGKEPFFSKQQD